MTGKTFGIRVAISLIILIFGGFATSTSALDDYFYGHLTILEVVNHDSKFLSVSGNLPNMSIKIVDEFSRQRIISMDTSVELERNGVITKLPVEKPLVILNMPPHQKRVLVQRYLLVMLFRNMKNFYKTTEVAVTPSVKNPMKVVNGKVGNYNFKMELSNGGKDLYMTVRGKLYLQYETDINDWDV